MIHGVLNIYKEQGFTSHDVVAKLRGILRQKKIGHTGTLDPAATGVLPVCLGKATKLCGMLTDETKSYETVLLLGQTTDTQDTTGTVLKSCPVQVTEEEVREAVGSFTGEQLQVPPMYSALKVNGKKLYELAREGKEIERKARKVQFYRIEILDLELPRVRMEVTCSKGTYIRTLCHDLGEKLGCGGCMERLERTQVGCFSKEESMTLSQVEALQKAGELKTKITPIPDLFAELPAVRALPEEDPYLNNGNSIYRTKTEEPELWENGAQVRMYRSDGAFVGIFRCEEETEKYAPVKMFLQD